jgi:hypothetical protein
VGLSFFLARLQLHHLGDVTCARHELARDFFAEQKSVIDFSAQ